MHIEIKDQAAKKIRRGIPLIQKEDLKKNDEKLPREWVEFIDKQGKYIATGYLGKQNKGVGWVVDRSQASMEPAFFDQLFQKAIDQRQFFLSDNNTTAFRLFNGEGDGLGGITVDYYDGYLVVSWYNETIHHFRRMLTDCLQKILHPKGIVEKIRFSSELPESNWVSGEKPHEPLIILENGVSYATYLDEGYMTGIFLDQKEVRSRLTEGAALGKRVLNMFSYTGAFSVAAAYGGAVETTSVDLAQRSLPKTKEQFEVNGLSLEQNRIVVMDTFEYFRYAARKNLKYDLIVLDPPSFARNKKKTFSVLKDYGRLIEGSLNILPSKGTIVASTNASNYAIEKFQTAIEQVFKDQKVSYSLSDSYRLPADFPVIEQLAESNYLKVLVYEIQKR
ncbi:class I SAM-dependent methyltransferase [Candidatus Enterococcus ferrettii]|uniref:23S rRNA (-C5)-methyltransferase n=1 Tax=Candidatus Enterococcus ferrettii TaxID=2815324 RepID=A0ABV0ET12_9ENTE|nr:class I SAM-dependent rRNA methyltransferase [Enterococcus sp. 665A]